jgi:hypothetical protein
VSGRPADQSVSLPRTLGLALTAALLLTACGGPQAPESHSTALAVDRRGNGGAVDPASGALRRSLELPAELSGRPGLLGERLVVGSLKGSFFVVNRTGWFSATGPTGD